MSASARKEKIREYFLKYKSASVSDLAATFRVSEETIRRDLVALDREGFIVRTHGGAVFAKRVSTTVDNEALGRVFLENKQVIARQCLDFIHEGDCIFIDASTTAGTICDLIAGMTLTVLTNSLQVINSLCRSENISLICVGGTYSANRNCFLGRTTNEVLKGHFVDTAFISCRSLSMEYGITDSNDDEAESKQIVCKHANRVCMLADHSKFGMTSFTKVCDFSDIHDLVTDKPLSEEWLHFAEDLGIRVWDTADHGDPEEN